MSIYDGDESGMGSWQLKNISQQKFVASSSNSFITKNVSYIRMYKRTQFSMNIGIGGIQQFLASKFRPNILTTSISLKADGIVAEGETLIQGETNPVQYEEFYLPALGILQSFIERLYAPKDILLVSEQSGDNAGDNRTNIVLDTYKGKHTHYPTTSISFTQEFKLYYPAMSNHGVLSNKLIALQISAQDKVYSLTKTFISG